MARQAPSESTVEASGTDREMERMRDYMRNQALSSLHH